MLAELTSVQVTEWMAFLSLEPLPHEQAALYAAQQACISAAPHMKQAPKTKDFVLDFVGEEEPETDADKVDQMAKKFQSMFGV